MTTAVEVKGWFIRYINKSRTFISMLDANKSKMPGGFHDTRPPCQVEVFWVRDPVEFTVVYISHNQQREDKQVVVHGPIKLKEYPESLQILLNNDHWKVPRPDDTTAGRSFASSVLRPFLKSVSDCVSSAIAPDDSLEGHQFGDNKGWATVFLGCIATRQVESFLEEIEQEIKKGKTKEVPLSLEIKIKGNEAKPAGIARHGARLYPPIHIGIRSSQSIAQIVRGIPGQVKEYHFVIDGTPVTINSTGLVTVEEPGVERAQDIVNAIIIAARYTGRCFLAVRRSELEIEMPFGSLARRSTMRTYLMNDPKEGFIEPNYTISEEEFMSIANHADKIFRDGQTFTYLYFLVEAHTHLLMHEYMASFLVAWNAIERLLKAKASIEEEDIRIKKIIDLLKEQKVLDEDTTNNVNNIRIIRNDFIHRGRFIASQDAEKCLAQYEALLPVLGIRTSGWGKMVIPTEELTIRVGNP